MTASMIHTLILKDLYFSRPYIAMGLPAGLLSLGLVYFGNQLGFYMGVTLLITVVVGLGMFIIFETVINERKMQTLPFIMSLPVTPLQYLCAKLWGNLLIYFMSWGILAVGTTLVILGRDAIPNGLLPLAILVLVELLVAHCLILAVALMTESQGWTIGAMVVCNLFFQLFLYTVSNHPGIKPFTQSASPVWSSMFFTFLGLLFVTATAALSIAFWIQTRKKDFL